jgi:BirA family biotin operon repressor/biotin-[acetyl-CoA-carboxylase] ligase
MEHIHMKQCQSTQEEAFNYLKSNQDKDVLVSCDKQLAGRGQRGKSWFSANNCLAMSLNLSAPNTLTLTSLEIGVLVSKFFDTNYDLSIGLKWPNDLFYNGKKCGGILIQKNQFLICGIGINLSHEKDYPNDIKSITDIGLASLNSKDLAIELYNFILSNRLSDEEIRNQFHDRCIHLNKMVEIHEDQNKNIGTFLEIGPYGEARVEISSEVKNFYSASLLIL